jgi:hypothetical protein
MTFRRLTEAREGKTLSDANAAHLLAAHQHLKAVFDDADIDPDAEPVEPDVGGPQGDQNAPVPNPASAADGTGSRSVPFVPIIRTTPPVVHRGGPSSGVERR